MAISYATDINLVNMIIGAIYVLDRCMCNCALIQKMLTMGGVTLKLRRFSIFFKIILLT